MHVKVWSQDSLHAATLGHLISTTESNYSKIFQIQMIIAKMRAGARDDQFSVAGYSSDLYASSVRPPKVQDTLILLGSKAGSPAKFWDHIQRLRRPIVFFKGRGGDPWEWDEAQPLYSASNKDALKIISARVRTPINIKFEGLGDIIKQLFYGRSEQKRIQEKHELEMESLKIQNAVSKVKALGEAISIAKQLENSGLSSTAKNKILEVVHSSTMGQYEVLKRMDARVEIGDDE